MTDRKASNVYNGLRQPEDIRSFYTSELGYLRAMQRRYACQWCGTSSMECPSCSRVRVRIEELERAR